MLSKLRSGAFETAAQWLVPSPGTMSAEEFVHMLMYARTLQDQGIAVRTTMLQEVPSLSCGMATILAGAGSPYVIKGAYDLRNPHLKEQEYFTFRYSLCSASRPFHPAQAVHFARQIAQDLPRAWVTGEGDAPLPLVKSFGSVTPENIIVTGFKTAEDGEGWVLRLWECTGQATDAAIEVSGLNATQAWECDLLEGKKASLDLVKHIMRLNIPARGLKAVRFV